MSLLLHNTCDRTLLLEKWLVLVLNVVKRSVVEAGAVIKRRIFGEVSGGRVGRGGEEVGNGTQRQGSVSPQLHLLPCGRADQRKLHLLHGKAAAEQRKRGQHQEG